MSGNISGYSCLYSQRHYIVNQKDFVRDLVSFASLTILLEIITAIFLVQRIFSTIYMASFSIYFHRKGFLLT